MRSASRNRRSARMQASTWLLALAVLLALGSQETAAAVSGMEAPTPQAPSSGQEEEGQAPTQDAEGKSGDDPQSSEETDKESFWSRFKDPEDGKFDITAHGKGGASGFLPLLIPFNEPAIGFGFIGAVVFFHPEKETASPSKHPSQKVPPTSTFAGGAYSRNGTWAAAVGHMGKAKDGDVRYMGALFVASANLDFYGVGADEANEEPIPFNIKAGGLAPKVSFRLGGSKYFVGGKYVFLSTDVDFESSGEEEQTDAGESSNAGLSAFIPYDSRDNIFTPDRGTKATASLSYFSDALGGDFDYGRLDLAYVRYWNIHDRVILGLRVLAHGVGDDAPFYALPFVSMRGIPVFRYLGNYVVSAEIEPRWKLDERWSVLAFVGAGRAAKALDELSDAEKAYGYGVGFRYLLSRKLGLAAGLDAAWGPEDRTGYIIFGSAWAF